jgi:hypothetical protein
MSQKVVMVVGWSMNVGEERLIEKKWHSRRTQVPNESESCRRLQRQETVARYKEIIE